MLGLAYNDGKDAKAAEAELNRAVALAPDFAPAQAELGHAYAYQSQYARAAEQFTIARRLDPQSTDYLFALGEAVGMEARSLDQYREAAAVQEECLKASPSNPALMFTLGQLHLRFMNLDKAYDCLRKASALRPKHAKTWLNLARVSELRGDKREARWDYEQFERQVSLHNRTILAEKSAAANPKDARARLELARSFHAEGNLKGCYVQLRAALSIDPGLAEAQADLGLLQAEFQRLLDQNGSMAAKMEENNPTGPPGPEETLSSETEKSGGLDR
jgi:Flp pilus assembly protein TadD